MSASCSDTFEFVGDLLSNPTSVSVVSEDYSIYAIYILEPQHFFRYSPRSVTVKRHRRPEKDEPSPSTDWKELIAKWIVKRWGRKGIVVFVVILASTGSWWKWDEVAKVPGIAEVVKLLSREKLPHADPNRFSIAVAHLLNDTNSEDEDLLVDALTRFATTDQKSGTADLQILKFDSHN